MHPFYFSMRMPRNQSHHAKAYKVGNYDPRDCGVKIGDMQVWEKYRGHHARTEDLEDTSRDPVALAEAGAPHSQGGSPSPMVPFRLTSLQFTGPNRDAMKEGSRRTVKQRFGSGATAS